MTVPNGTLTIERQLDGSQDPTIYLFSLLNSQQGTVPAPPYDWTQDTLLLGRWEAGSLANQGFGPDGPLVVAGGSDPTVSSAIDGHPAWRLTRGSGVRLATATYALIEFPPIEIILVVRATGTPVAGDFLLEMINSTGYGISYVNSTTLNILGTVNITVPASGWYVLRWYNHGSASYVSVNNGPIVPFTMHTNNYMTGLCLGANNDGTSSGGWDIAAAYRIEGQASTDMLAGLTSYIRARWPSAGMGASPPAPISVDQTSRGSLPAGAFDIIWITGQSNNCNLAATNPAAAGANTYVFDHGNQIVPMVRQYDGVPSGGDYMDRICQTGILNGGNGTSLANTYTAGTGRPVLLVPCACGGSAMVFPNSTNVWDPTKPYGHNLRNSLFWSAVARVRNAIALGGTFRFLWHYQGETEAGVGGATAAAHASVTNTILNRLCDEAGVPRRQIVQTIADTVSTASGADIATIQAGQASLAIPGLRLIAPKNNNLGADNIHLNGTGCDQVGTAAANLALAQTAGTGWH